MKLADLFTLEPAPIYGQFVQRIEPLGPWPAMGKPKDAAYMRALRLRQVRNAPPEVVQAIQSGMRRREAMKRFGLSSSGFYRIRNRRS